MRKEKINEIVIKSNHIIYKFGDTIKKIDIIMNDGISKMAEYTAGYPFHFSIVVNNLTSYTYHPIGKIRLNIKAIPTYGKGVRIGNYDKNNLILLNSSSPVNYSVNKSSLESADILDDYIIIDAKNCQKNDIISVTVIVEEVKDNIVFEKRGFSTLVLVIQNWPIKSTVRLILYTCIISFFIFNINLYFIVDGNVISKKPLMLYKEEFIVTLIVQIILKK